MDLIRKVESIRRLADSHGDRLPGANEARDQIESIAREMQSFLLEDMTVQVRKETDQFIEWMRCR